jgi:cellulose synthase operon protein C
MISYAGERDPITGAVWGGVTATGVRAGFTHGTADSGFYANLSGARLSGTHVNDNSSVQGSAGAYFKFFANQYGVLKVGANVTGMRYAQNQQYFTYGQGGYFSPDSYLLVNAPITFEGRQGRFAYRVNGSLGMQTFTEGTPLAGSFIAAQTVTAPTTNANYNLNADVSYKLQQNWYIGTFLNVNNARDYQERAGGFSLRYMTRPQTIAEGSPTGLIDRKAPLPLIVP